ncbi:MAG: hypothetical protein LC677_13310 [Halomonas sp.]|nr:hypothetical protein [Halomonas sp.]
MEEWVAVLPPAEQRVETLFRLTANSHYELVFGVSGIGEHNATERQAE